MKRTALLILLLLPLMLSAQENSNLLGYSRFRMGVEGGVGLFVGDVITQSPIRVNYDDPGYFTGVFNRLTLHYCLGAMSEYSFNSSLSLAAGLRFLGSYSELNSGGWGNYFLWKVSETDLVTRYVRLGRLEQNNFYLGIPVEFTVFTYKEDIPVRHFFKAGVNFNFLLTSKTTPDIQNEAMNKYANEIVNGIDKSNVFAAAFVGTGLKFGKMNHFFGLVEIRVPFALKGNLSSFAKSSVGFELHTTMYFPMGKKKVYYISND